MTWLRNVLHELVGLFVDSGSFAAAIVVWVLVSALILPHLGSFGGPILFVGLGAILLESVIRRARGR